MKFGWVPDLPDRRDHSFLWKFGALPVLPLHVDLRDRCPPIRDQGELGSCTAMALIGALEFLFLRAYGVLSKDPGYRELSALFCYFNERAADGNISFDAGSTLRTGIKQMVKKGSCLDTLWPYKPDMFSVAPDAGCFTDALSRQVVGYQRLRSLADMKGCLARGLPFVFGFTVYESATTAAVGESGFIPQPTLDERALGGHAVMAVGYDDADRTFLIRNSWGTKWGQAGYGTIPQSTLENRDLSDDFWTIQRCEKGD